MADDLRALAREHWLQYVSSIKLVTSMIEYVATTSTEAADFLCTNYRIVPAFLQTFQKVLGKCVTSTRSEQELARKLHQVTAVQTHFIAIVAHFSDQFEVAFLNSLRQQQQQQSVMNEPIEQGYTQIWRFFIQHTTRFTPTAIERMFMNEVSPHIAAIRRHVERRLSQQSSAIVKKMRRVEKEYGKAGFYRLLQHMVTSPDVWTCEQPPLISDTDGTLAKCREVYKRVKLQRHHFELMASVFLEAVERRCGSTVTKDVIDYCHTLLCYVEHALYGRLIHDIPPLEFNHHHAAHTTATTTTITTITTSEVATARKDRTSSPLPPEMSISSLAPTVSIDDHEQNGDDNYDDDDDDDGLMLMIQTPPLSSSVPSTSIDRNSSIDIQLSAQSSVDETMVAILNDEPNITPPSSPPVTVTTTATKRGKAYWREVVRNKVINARTRRLCRLHELALQVQSNRRSARWSSGMTTANLILSPQRSLHRLLSASSVDDESNLFNSNDVGGVVANAVPTIQRLRSAPPMLLPMMPAFRTSGA